MTTDARRSLRIHVVAGVLVLGVSVVFRATGALADPTPQDSAGTPAAEAENPDALLRRAQELRQAGQLTAARDFARAALAALDRTTPCPARHDALALTSDIEGALDDRPSSRAHRNEALRLACAGPAARALLARAGGGHEIRWGDLDAAAGLFRLAAAAHASAADPRGQGEAATALAELERTAGTIDELMANELEAAAWFEQAGDLTRAAGALLAAADAQRSQGRRAEARVVYEAAHVRYQRASAAAGMAGALHGLGEVERGDGRLDQANARYAASRAIYRQLGDARGEAAVMGSLAEAEQASGRPVQARDLLAEALRIYLDLGDRGGEANIRMALGGFALRAGDTPAAVQQFGAALPLYEEFGDRLGQANAYSGLASAARPTDQPRARTLFLRSAELYLSFGMEGAARTARERAEALAER